MDLGNLVNENISKKFGLALFSMYLVSKCEDQNIAYVIAAIAVAGILGQTIVDAVKAWNGRTHMVASAKELMKELDKQEEPITP